MPVARRRARLDVLVLAVVLGVTGCGSHPKRFYLVGDSLADLAHHYWEKDLRAHGAKVRTLAIGGTAACNLLHDLPKVIAFHPDAVVVSYIGNLLPPCLYPPGTPLDIDNLVRYAGAHLAEVVGRYRADIGQIVTTLTRAHIRVYLVIAPRPRSDTALADGVADVVRQLADRDPHDNVRLIDGGRDIAPNRTYADLQPCLPKEPCKGPVVNSVPMNQVRWVDGTHFDCQTPKEFFAPCNGYSSGAWRYARNLSEPLIHDYHLAA